MFKILSVLIFLVFLSPADVSARFDPTVKEAQQRLDELGYQPGPIDGYWGKRTKEALRLYQAKHGIPVTGELNEVTQKALGLTNETNSGALASSGQAICNLAGQALKEATLQGVNNIFGGTTTIRSDNPMPVELGSGFKINASGKEIRFYKGIMKITTESNVLKFTDGSECAIDGDVYIYQGGEWLSSKL